MPRGTDISANLFSLRYFHGRMTAPLISALEENAARKYWPPLASPFSIAKDDGGEREGGAIFAARGDGGKIRFGRIFERWYSRHLVLL